MLDQIVATMGGENAIWWMAGGYFSMVIGERLYHLIIQSKTYNNADALCSIGLNLMNSVIGLGVSVLLPLAA
jgi:hypothetical protein